jgi:regulatory protein
MSKRISALKIQKNNPQRVNVYLEGEFAFGLSKIVAAWLQIDQELTEEKIDQLRQMDEVEVVYQRAIHFIHYRDRSEAEIRHYLAKKGTTEQLIEIIISRLHEHGLINDHRFAKNWVENRAEFRPRGKLALRYELKKFGISQTEIDRTLSDIDEEALAYRFAIKQAGKYKNHNLDKKKFREKMYQSLARRGFNHDCIALALQKILEEQTIRDYFNHTIEEVNS